MFPALTESMLRRAFRQRDIRVNGQRVGQDVPLAPGDVVRWYIDDKYLFPSAQVVYQDARMLVAVKPAGIPVEGTESLTALLSAQTGRPVYPAHRLDVKTQGLLLFAKTRESEAALLELIRMRQLEKQYQCLVVGAPPKRQGVVETGLLKNAKTACVTVCAMNAPGAKPAKTGYRVLKSQGGLSLVQVDLYTGRTHQIRVHMAHLGCPVLGDDKYGDRLANRAHHAEKLFLCACRLVLRQKDGPFADLYGHAFQIAQPFGREWE